MTKVLDCQNDLILVASTAETDADTPEEPTTQNRVEEYATPECLFINQKSTEHFGFNLNDAGGLDSDMYREAKA